MSRDLLFNRNEYPFGIPWERWACSWYQWMMSAPKWENPCVDETGKYCSANQRDKNVWFLAGTFGNIGPVNRKCTIPLLKAIFFPLLVKEDSFAEDFDLKSEAELIKRSRNATDKVIQMEATIEKEDCNRMISLQTEELKKYRVQSEVFDLFFPEDNVYGVRAGLTRSVCDGFWLFMKPLEMGNYRIHFKGETSLAETFTRNKMKKLEVYSPSRELIEGNLFRVDVSYELIIDSKNGYEQ